MITTSTEIEKFAAAMALAQAEMTGAKKDSQNPHFKSAYADLASVREACMAAFNKHGISVLQSPRAVAHDGQLYVELETRLLHTSGQWMGDTLSVPVSKADAQGVGSATTYARRYALAAFAGIAPADDDGESAVGRGTAKAMPIKAALPVEPEGFAAWWEDFTDAADNGPDALKAAWEATPQAIRNHATATKRDAITKLKDKAKAVAA